MYVDAHLDLAHSAIGFNRDLLTEVSDLRREQKTRSTPPGIPTVSLPAVRRAGIGLVFATLFQLPYSSGLVEDESFPLAYHTAEEAHAQAQQQLDYYHRLADENPSIRLVGDGDALAEVEAGQDQEKPLLGVVPLMEGADAVRDPAELEMWWQRGLRIIGPAWDDTVYAAGNMRGSSHGFTKRGFQLMETMADLGFILDVSHLNEQACLEAVEQYPGPLIASHSNCRHLVDHVGQRNLTDKQIELLGERGAVIGIALYNKFLRQGATDTDRKETVTLDHVVAHIDHVCQILGDARHVGLGSDLDGGFGWADIPAEIDTIADIDLIPAKLKARGYEPEHIVQIMGGNWTRRLREAWSG